MYEDEKYIAFLDINPVNFGHTLVIPREHYTSFDETPAEVLADLTRLTKKLSPAIVKAAKADGYNITVNNGKAAGQVIDHIHFHIIPRYETDGFKAWQGRARYAEGEMGATAKKIKEELL